MRFSLTIDMDNAAFEDDETELPRLLRRVAERVTPDSEREGTVRDANGNTVGRWTIRP